MRSSARTDTWRRDRRGESPASRLFGLVAGLALTSVLLLATGCTTEISFFEPKTSSGGAGQIPNVPPPPTPNSLRVTGTFNLARDSSGDRTCDDGGDGVGYRVVALNSEGATLEKAPSSGCLEEGEEVLLIAQKGSDTSVEQVGDYELLRVLEVEGPIVRFVSAPTRSYGATLGKNDALAARNVGLYRVPTYSRLVVESGGTLTSDGFDGELGGVLVARAVGDVVVDGTVTMSAKGFRGASETSDVSTTGLQGESIAGRSLRSIENAHGGGGGGLGDQMTDGCVQDGNSGGGGGHFTAGRSARVEDLCGGVGAGKGGGAYATSTRIFLGSGGGAGGTDNKLVDNPFGGAGGAGGGLVWILAQTVAGSGTLRADGADGVGDPRGTECVVGYTTDACYDHSGPGGGGAGGSLRISANLSGMLTLSAAGGLGGNGYDQATGDGGNGGEGFVQID